MNKIAQRSKCFHCRLCNLATLALSPDYLPGAAEVWLDYASGTATDAKHAKKTAVYSESSTNSSSSSDSTSSTPSRSSSSSSSRNTNSGDSSRSCSACISVGEPLHERVVTFNTIMDTLRAKTEMSLTNPSADVVLEEPDEPIALDASEVNEEMVPKAPKVAEAPPVNADKRNAVKLLIYNSKADYPKIGVKRAHRQPEQLSCSHIYHENCIMPWLDAQGCCPICQKSFAGCSSDVRTTFQERAEINE